MAETTSLHNLPIDAIDCIVNYISVKDLSSCCAVSRTWHRIFNCDMFWKRLCNKNLSAYLEKSDCYIESEFNIPLVKDCTSTQVHRWRSNFLREQHLWRNWRSGRFKIEEIEFDCDDSICYNIKVEFANDFVFLHTTFQTEVWNVSQKPNLVMTIPFGLNELWEQNVYRVVKNKLVVIQCNVVQVFNICLVTQSWSFAFAFFFDKPEEFSSDITEETDINAIFEEMSSTTPEDVVCVISGDYLVGILTNETSLKKPVIYVWNIVTGKKVKEQLCPTLNCNEFSGFPSDVVLKVSETSPQNILVVFETDTTRRGSSCSFIYDLTKLDFGTFSKYCHNGDPLIFDRYLCILHGSTLEFVTYCSDNNSASQVREPVTRTVALQHPCSIRVLNNSVVLANNKEILTVNPSSGETYLLFKVDFTVCDFNVIQNRFLVFHDMEYSIREIWEVGKLYKKILSFPEDTGMYRAVNEVCTKIVLERANKLIILHFW